MVESEDFGSIEDGCDDAGPEITSAVQRNGHVCESPGHGGVGETDDERGDGGCDLEDVSSTCRLEGDLKILTNGLAGSRHAQTTIPYSLQSASLLSLFSCFFQLSGTYQVHIHKPLNHEQIP